MATQDLAHVNHHVLIHFIKGMRVAIIPPSAIPFVTHFDCCTTMSTSCVISSMKHTWFLASKADD